MAERTLNTRIKLRYASYAEWMSSTVKLLAGEVAVCYVEANNEHVKNTAPTVLFKVGDGEHVFSELQWASARAADVYDWAKAENLSIEKQGTGNVVASISWDTTNKKFIYNTASVATSEGLEDLQKTVATLTSDLNTLAGRVGVNEGAIAGLNTEVAKKLNSSDFETFTEGYNTTISGINGALANKADASSLNNYYTKEQADGKFLTGHQDISGKADKTYVDEELGKKANTSYVNDELAKKVDLETYNGRVTAVDNRFGGIDGKISGIEGGIADINEELGNIDTDLGEINTTLAGKADASALNSYELKADADLVRGRVNTLEGYFDEGGRVTVAEGKISTLEGAVSTIMNGTDAEKIDSLNDLINWADEHAPEVESIKEGIEANAEAIEGLKSSKADKTDLNGYYTKDEVDGIKSNLEGSISGVDSKFAGYYTQTEINTKVSALEGSISTVDGKLANYETIAEADKVRGRVGTLEGQVANLHNYDDTEVRGLISGNAAEIKTLKETTVPGLEDRIEVLEGKPFDSYATKSEVETVDGKVDGIIADYLKGADKTELSNAIASAVKTEKERAEAAEKGLGDRLTAVETDFLSSKDVIIWDCGGAN